MDSQEIKKLVMQLGSSGKIEDEKKIWGKLKPVGEKIVHYFLEAYPKAKGWESRASYMFHSIKYAKTNKEALQLGILGLKDKSTIVRYRACQILAYSLKKEVLPFLEEALSHKDSKTIEDVKATINAIKKGNHHLFHDRDNSGKIKWFVKDSEGINDLA